MLQRLTTATTSNLRPRTPTIRPRQIVPHVATRQSPASVSTRTHQAAATPTSTRKQLQTIKPLKPITPIVVQPKGHSVFTYLLQT